MALTQRSDSYCLSKGMMTTLPEQPSLPELLQLYKEGIDSIRAHVTENYNDSFFSVAVDQVNVSTICDLLLRR